MPYKSEKLRLPKQYDRRIKLTDTQREEIKEKYTSGFFSQRALAREYGVSRRLISFVISPEKYEIAREQFKERRKDGRYNPTKEERNGIQKEHRAYKHKLLLDGKLSETSSCEEE